MRLLCIVSVASQIEGQLPLIKERLRPRRNFIKSIDFDIDFRNMFCLAR